MDLLRRVQRGLEVVTRTFWRPNENSDTIEVYYRGCMREAECLEHTTRYVEGVLPTERCRCPLRVIASCGRTLVDKCSRADFIRDLRSKKRCQPL